MHGSFLLKGAFRDGVEAGTMLSQVGVPFARVPKLQMIANADEHDFLFEPRETYEAIGNERSAHAIEFDGLHLCEEQPAKNADIAAGRWGLIELLRQRFEILLIEHPQALIGARRHEQMLDVAELLAHPLGERDAGFVVESSRMSAGQEHDCISVPALRSGLFATSVHFRPLLSTDYQGRGGLQAFSWIFLEMADRLGWARRRGEDGSKIFANFRLTTRVSSFLMCGRNLLGSLRRRSRHPLLKSPNALPPLLPDHSTLFLVGTIMLIVMLLRSIAGHFTAEHHFAFEAVSWYWHFVDVVWVLLFILVYWLI